MCEALTYLLDNISIRFGTTLYIQIVGISIGNICAPLKDVLFLFCYERDFIASLIIKTLKLFKHLTLHLNI